MGSDHAVALRLRTGQVFAANPFFDTIWIAVTRFQKQQLYPGFNQVTLDGFGFERLNKPPSQKPIFEFKLPAVDSCSLPWLAFR
ncbi:MAG: hypothetical protein ABL936_22065 [Aestuariivirga sp.]